MHVLSALSVFFAFSFLWASLPEIKDMLCYVMLLVCNDFVFKTRRFSDIRLQKYRDFEIRIRGHTRSLKVVPFDRLGMVSNDLVLLAPSWRALQQLLDKLSVAATSIDMLCNIKKYGLQPQMSV